MKLVSLQIFPRGNYGWQSEPLYFGDHITQLYGPNGCGKTPIIQSIAYCLGYPSEFRNDIYEQCDYAILEIRTAKGILKLKRIYSKKNTDITVYFSDDSKQRFFTEKEYSEFIFEWIGLKTRSLITKRNQKTSPYLSTVLPIYYIDQDIGYSRFYCPPRSSTFIKDQFAEMIRMLFDLPAKNSFDAKKARIQAKKELDFLDKQVETHRSNLKIAKDKFKFITKSSTEISIGLKQLKFELNDLKKSGTSHDDSVLVLDQLIVSRRKQSYKIKDEAQLISDRCNGLDRIVLEIDTEIATLNLNEGAKRIFLSFEEICAAPNCQLFARSSESYSKNLLYLKDQIKDLERNAELDKVRIGQLNNQKTDLDVYIKQITDERDKIIDQDETSALVEAISEIKNQIFDLQSDLDDIREIENLEKRFIDVLESREQALDRYQSFTPQKSSIPKIVQLKSDLRQIFLSWLDIINTENISRDISFKEDFTPELGTEKISQFKGSTRVRAVLAFHAALIELILLKTKNNFGFLILDTPKQQEVSSDDLDNFFKKLKKLSLTTNLQIIFSTTEYHYVGDKSDKEWIPAFPGIKHKMFLQQLQPTHEK